MKQISLTQIRQFLKKIPFNPRILHPLKIIADIGNSDFYEQRAIEFIKEATSLMERNGDFELYEEYIISSIRLLILARETRNGQRNIN